MKINKIRIEFESLLAGKFSAVEFLAFDRSVFCTVEPRPTPSVWGRAVCHPDEEFFLEFGMRLAFKRVLEALVNDRRILRRNDVGLSPEEARTLHKAFRGWLYADRIARQHEYESLDKFGFKFGLSLWTYDVMLQYGNVNFTSSVYDTSEL